MKLLKRHIAIALCLAGMAIPALAAPKGWEAAKGEKPKVQHIVSETDIEIKAGGGMIYVNTSKTVHIRIFTILGSLVADDTLQPGSYQFTVSAHGVYIIKAGDVTCKVAV